MSIKSYYSALQSAVGPKPARAYTRAKVAYALAQRVGGPAFSKLGTPSLAELTSSFSTISSVRELVATWGDVDCISVESLESEFEEVQSTVLSRYESLQLSAPTKWAVEDSTAHALYLLVRTLEPQSVVETGVANGHSTALILEAMRRNGRGHLTSIDVNVDVGQLVADDVVDRWTKLIVEPHTSPLELQQRIEHVPVDVFFHDGDHSYIGQMIDYETSKLLLRDGGLLISDDVDASYAWLNAAARDMLPPSRRVMIDTRKVVGLAW